MQTILQSVVVAVVLHMSHHYRYCLCYRRRPTTLVSCLESSFDARFIGMYIETLAATILKWRVFNFDCLFCDLDPASTHIIVHVLCYKWAMTTLLTVLEWAQPEGSTDVSIVSSRRNLMKWRDLKVHVMVGFAFFTSSHWNKVEFFFFLCKKPTFKKHPFVAH
jgi:hypothetical protein